jgi:hypothetical protein
VWDGYYFLGAKGFQKYGQVENYPDRRIPQSLSDNINPEFEKINKAQLEKPSAIFTNDAKYFCAVPINGSTTNNIIFVLNKRFMPSPWTFYTGINASYFAIFNNELYYSDELEPKLYKFNKKFVDQYDSSTGEGFAIECKYKSKTFIPSYKNWFKRMFIRGAMTNPCTIQLRLNVDGNSELIKITETDIQWERDISGVVGYDVVGQIDVGGEIQSSSDEPLYTFLAEIHFPKTVNQGREFYFELENNGLSEGFRIDWIDIEGTYLSTTVIK